MKNPITLLILLSSCSSHTIIKEDRLKPGDLVQNKLPLENISCDRKFTSTFRLIDTVQGEWLAQEVGGCGCYYFFNDSEIVKY